MGQKTITRVVISGYSQGTIVRDDPEDDKFIHCAVSGNADYIVSGDSHLLKLGGYGKVKIVNASDFLGMNGSDPFEFSQHA